MLPWHDGKRHDPMIHQTYADLPNIDVVARVEVDKAFSLTKS